MKEKWRRLAIGGGAGMFVGMGLGRFAYSAMVPAIVEAGEMSAVAAGRVGMINLAGFLCGAVLSVPLAHAVGRTHVLRAALAVAVAGLAASALAWGPVWLGACRGAIGVATSLIMVLALALIAETAPAERRAAAAGYVFAGVGLGIMASGVLVPWLLRFGLAAAWLGIVAAAVAAAAVAIWGWMDAPNSVATSLNAASRFASPALTALLYAHALFSFGIVPHTLYWVDYLARGAGLGMSGAGAHWVIVGLFAMLGPLATTMLARAIGVAWALVVGFGMLALGVGAPGLASATALLLVSSMIFGAQPGLSSLMAARARELAQPEQMNRVMRAMILANAAGGVAGGIVVPWALAAQLRAGDPLSADYGLVFLLGGAALACGAVAAWPWPARAAGR